MKVHHLNCATLCSRIGGSSDRFVPHELVCHVLLIETESGLVLVDCGLSQEDMKNPKNLGPVRLALKFSRDLKESALERVKALGFSPKDVTHIIPTHLDLDHAGGVVDFPRAKVHVMDLEHKAALFGKGFLTQARYRRPQMESVKNWQIYRATDGEPWMGFQKIQKVLGVKEDLFLVPLPGHTVGHFGVAVRTKQDEWLLHCGDAYYDHREVLDPKTMPPGIRLFRRLVHENFQKALKTQKEIAQIYQRPGLQVFCAHDHSEFQRMLTEE